MSLLSKQIARLNQQSVTQGVQGDSKKNGRPVSLLFSPTDAAEIDATSLLELARGSLAELQHRDARLLEFSSTLFHASSTSLDRALLDAAENARLDKSLSRFLLLLSPYCSTKPAHRVLEYLIRQYHVERLNVNALMDCCLLFHDTPFFVKLLQITNLDAPGSIWGFLKGCRQRSEALPRSALAERAAYDPSLLAFLGAMLFRAAGLSPEVSLQPTSQAWQARVSWYAATVAAAVDVRAPSEDFLRALLPQLAKAAALQAAPSVQVGCYMVAIKLAVAQVLSRDASELLLTVVVQAHAPPFADHALAAAVTLAASLDALPAAALDALLAVPSLADALAVATERVDGARFMHLLLPALLHRLPTNPTPLAATLCELISLDLPVAAAVPGVVKQALVLAADKGSEAGSPLSAAAAAIVAKCAACYPLASDEAVRAALAELQGSAKAAALAALTQTPSMRLQPAGDLGTTFWLALEHPRPEMRTQAVTHALELDGGVSADLAPALLRRLDDSSAAVVAAFAAHANAAPLLASCCADPPATLAHLERARRRWSQELATDPEASAPAVAGLLRLLVELPGTEASAVAVALVEHFPNQAEVRRAEQLKPAAQAALAAVWAAALGGAAALFKATGYALFAHLAAPKHAPKKGQFEATCVAWAAAASSALASSLLAGTAGPSLLAADAWRTLPAAAQATLLNALAGAVLGAGGGSKASECAVGLLVRTLPALPAAPEQLQRAVLELCVATVTQGGPRPWASGDLLLAQLLRLAPAAFADPSAQQALHHLLATHLALAPLRGLAAVYAQPRGAGEDPATTLARIRALAISATFVSALAAGGVSVAAQKQALGDAAFVLPHVLSALQHPTKLVRQAGVALLAAVDGCSSIAALKGAAAALPAHEWHVKGAAAVALGGADLFKLCGSLVAREAELLMDPGALGACLGGLFLHDSPDRAWKKARAPCLHFLVAHAANLGCTDGARHVGAHVLATLGWRVGGPSALQAHVKVAWPYCEALAAEALAHAAKGGNKHLWASEVLALCADSFVFVGGPVPAAPLNLAMAALDAAAAAGDPVPPSLRAAAKHVLRGTTNDFCAHLDQAQAERLFVAALGAGRALPTKSALLRDALENLSPSPATLAQVVNAAASAKAPEAWLAAASFALIALDRPVARFLAAAADLDPALPLLDATLALLDKCHDAASTDEVAFCQVLACGLAAQLVDHATPFNALHGRASAYSATLRACVESGGKRPVRVTAAATAALAALAKRCPEEMASSTVGMVQRLSVAAAADQDDDALFECTQLVLRSVLPHLKSGHGHASVGRLLRDLVAAFDGAGPRRVAICATLLQGLSSDVLPALVLLVDAPLGHAMATRSSPAAQVAAAVQLLEAAQASLAWARRGGPAPSLALGRSGMALDLSLLPATGGGLGVALACADFVANHLASRGLHFQLLRLGRAEEKETQTMYLHLCQQLLACMREAAESEPAPSPLKKRKGPASSVVVDDKALRSVVAALDRALGNLQGLLSVSGFVAVAQELLGDEDAANRRRALELLPGRVEAMQRDGGVSRDEAALFVDMVPELTAGLEASPDKATALCAVEILARHFAAPSPEPFAAALGTVTSLLEAGGLKNAEQSAALLCAATLCSALGTQAFPCLPRLMPVALLELGEGAAHHVRPALALLVAVAQPLAQFLHPYLGALLGRGAALAASPDSAVRHLSGLLFARLAAAVHLRLALPVAAAAFEAATCGGRDGDGEAAWLLGFCQQAVGAAAQKDLVAHLPPLSALLLEALKWEAVHGAAVEAVVAVVLRMNERQLSAFFLELVAWKGAGLQSRLTFFRVAEVLAERLKSIFVPFFEYFFDDCRAELDAVFADAPGPAKTKRHRAEAADAPGSDPARAARFFAALPEGDRRLHLRLLRAVAGSLKRCFEHDAPGGFVTKERVASVTQPLVRHLAVAAHDAKYAAEAVVPCVAQLAVVAGGDAAWKTLNYLVLMQTREESAVVRLAALEALHACFNAVGEEYLVMLPESLSFLSELLEDPDPAVEAKCRGVLKAAEELSGESLDSYL